VVAKKASSVNIESFPVFFRYMRMNEVSVNITYYHKKSHLLNIKEFKLKLPPLISHGTFLTYRETLLSYEKHCKRNFISQIPDIFKKKFLGFKSAVGSVKDAVRSGDKQSDKETKKEEEMVLARCTLLGDFG